MKAALCEDEALFREKLKKGIVDFFTEKKIEITVDEFNDGKLFIDNFTSEHEYDVIFMDINLGKGNDGLDITAKLREIDKKVPVIFVTSLENRAIDGYDVGAFGFIVKKTFTDKLPRVLEKLYKELFCKRNIVLYGKGGTEIIPSDKILWVESEGRGVHVHLKDGDFSDIRPIGQFAEILTADDFIPVHKSIYVNISEIKRINSDTVTLSSDISLPLSRRNRKNVMLSVMKKVGGK